MSLGEAFAAVARGEADGATPSAGFKAHAKEIADAVEVWGLTWPQIHVVLVRERVVSPQVPPDRLRKWWHEGVRKGWAKRVERGSRAGERPPVPKAAIRPEEPKPHVPEDVVVPAVQAEAPRSAESAPEDDAPAAPRKGRRIGQVM